MSRGRTIAILSPGEMGSQVGEVLHESGAQVVTWLAGRSSATRQRAKEAGLLEVERLEDLVMQADMVVSIVPSSAAQPLAQQVAAAMVQTGARPLYCDANSIGPATALKIEKTIIEAGGDFVDGAIIGGASGLRGRTTVYLSGEAADAAAAALRPIHTVLLGPEAGQASAFKVLYAGLTKGLSALGVELLAGAQRLGILELLLDKYRSDHSQIARFFQQTLPGLPSRAGRRAEEMIELAETLKRLGVSPRMAQSAQGTLEAVAQAFRDSGAPRGHDLADFVTWWVQANPSPVTGED